MWRKVWESLSREQRVLIGALFFLMVIAALFEVLGLGLILPFIQLVSNPAILQENEHFARVHAWLGEPQFDTFLYLTGALLTLGFVIKGALIALLNWCRAYVVQEKLYIPAARQMFSRYLHQPYVDHVQLNTATILRNITRDVANVYGSALNAALNIVAEGLVVVALIVGLLIVSPLLTLITAGMLSLTAWFIVVILRKRLIFYGRKQQKAQGMTFKWVQEGLGAVKDTKILGSYGYFLAAFDKDSTKLAEAQRHMVVAKALPRIVLEVMVVFSLVVAICLAFYLSGDQGGVNLPELIFLGAAAVRITPSFTRIVGFANAIQTATASVEVVFESYGIRTERDEQPAKDAEKEPLRLNSEIELRDLTFAYPGAETTTIDNVSLTIEKGQSVAFVGSTGAGKTTIIDMILGLISPDSGSIAVDGTDIEGARYAWRHNLGYVPQSVYLADMSVRDNVVFGQADNPSDEQVWKTLEDAQVADFIRSLPNGLDTLIGERGVRFSGGQRQRLGIARALFGNPDILVFDEATSALDNNTESRLTDAINQLGGTKTLVIIAHRLSTVRQCDKLFVLEMGRLVASGTYDELLEKSPEFRKLALQGDGSEVV